MVWVRFRNIIFLAINTLVLTPNWDLTSTLSICPISWAKDFALGFCPERSSTFWIVSHFYFSDSFVVGDVFSVTRKKKQNWKDVIIMFKVRPYVYVSGGLAWYCFQRLCCNTIAGTQTRQAAWDVKCQHSTGSRIYPFILEFFLKIIEQQYINIVNRKLIRIPPHL